MSRVDLEGCVAHRVRTGESLDSLARGIGISWRALARFNFGTDDPRGINAAVYAYVGSRRVDANGRNYVFDDQDDPGIVYLPKVVPEQSLATGQPHVIRLSRPRFKVPVDLETVDDLGRPVPNVPLVLMREDAELALDATSDEKGAAHLDDVPAGRYEVLLEDGSPAAFWRGIAPTYAPAARAVDVALEKAVVDTVNRHAVTSVVVKRASEEDRRAVSLLRQTHAVTAGRAVQSRPHGDSVREETGGWSRRSIRFMADNLVLAAGWTNVQTMDGVNVQSLVQDVLPGWLEDHCPAIQKLGYYVIVLEPARSALTLMDHRGNADAELALNRGVAGKFGAYSLFEAVSHNVYVDVATRSYVVENLGAKSEHEELRKRDAILIEEFVTDRDRFRDARRQYGWLQPVLLLVPSANDLCVVALNGGSGLLENYPEAAAANARVHARNLAVVRNAARAYERYVRKYERLVKGANTERELRAIGRPLSQYEFPAPLGATTDQLSALYREMSSADWDAWVAVGERLDQLADRRPEGMPFLKLSVQYEMDSTTLVDADKLRPEMKELLERVPVTIKVEGNLDIAFDRLDGARFIKKGTNWEANVSLKGKAKSPVEGLTGELDVGKVGVKQSIAEGASADASLKLAPSVAATTARPDGGSSGTASTGSTSTGSGVPVTVTAKGPAAWEAMQGPLPGGKKYASAEVPDSSLGVKVPPFGIELKSDGSASVSVDVEGVTVDSGWAPRTAEMSAGVSFSLDPLAKKLEAKHPNWAKHLKGVKIGATVGMVGSREETVLAVVSRAPGFFERRDTKELLDPATDWSTLTLDEQHFLNRLGWDEKSWNSKFDPQARQLPASCTKNRRQLEPAEKIAIVGLGFHAYEDYAAGVEEALTEFEKKAGSQAAAAGSGP